ncbi:LysE family translocator [Glaciibacter psychrotolerans]|uniref:Threonine/homoserine/homoserine lactone efflux protein n=1 Tax=Glaciibacter psychrotolerans TaxID=670054 RepID=A0A7Z0ECQ1_9MICO|nr:LysE family translocator [Leifsonia psychrotolerans]NYJ18512.1 threonine/homoserine/homoserine lactone efflux protein [Leifsonia psychrotolerans]
MMSLSGTAVGFVVYMVMVNLGLAAVFLVVPWLFIALKIAGAVYLLWLAYQTLRPGGKSLFETSELPRDSFGKLFRMGLLTNLLNPKVAILYLALIPQYIDPAAGSIVTQGFQLGAIQILVGVAVNGATIIAAGSVATFLQRKPTWMRWQKWVTGTLLGATGVKLAIDAPPPLSRHGVEAIVSHAVRCLSASNPCLRVNLGEGPRTCGRNDIWWREIAARDRCKSYV